MLKRIEFADGHWVEYDLDEQRVESSLTDISALVVSLLRAIEFNQKKYLTHPYFPNKVAWGAL